MKFLVKFFSSVYYRIVQWFVSLRAYFAALHLRRAERRAIRMLTETNAYLRHVIVLQNKDPDYVAPPPPPPPPAPAVETPRDYLSGDFRRGSANTAFAVPTFYGAKGHASEWINHPENNPVVLSRIAVKEKAEAKAKEEAARAARNEVVLQISVPPLTEESTETEVSTSFEDTTKNLH